MSDTSKEQATFNAFLERYSEICYNSMISRGAWFRDLWERRAKVDESCGFIPLGQPVPIEAMRDMYDREPIANRVVSCLPKESWQVQPHVLENEDRELTEFEQAFQDLQAGLNGDNSYYNDVLGSALWEFVSRGDELSGIGTFGIILLGLADGRLLEQPVAGSPPDGNPFTIPNIASAGMPSTARTIPGVFGRADQGPTLGPGTAQQTVKSIYGQPTSELSPESSIMDAYASTSRDIYGGATQNPVSSVLGTDAQYRGIQFTPGFYPSGDPYGPINPYAMPGMPPQQAVGGVTGGGNYYRGGNGSNGKNGKNGKKSQQGTYIGGANGPLNKLLFLRIFDESLVQVVQYEADLRNPRFGRPIMYLVTLNDPRYPHTGIGLPLATLRVHWSRVIHLADNIKSSEIFGLPRMQPVFNRIIDLRKLYGGSAEMYWQGALPGISFETQPQLGGDAIVDVPALKDMIKNYVEGLERYIHLQGLTARTLAPTVVSPTDQIETQIQAICIQLGIPIRVFKGSERGEMASSQDDASWNDKLRLRQNLYISPRVIAPLIDRLITLGVLPKPEKYKIKWPDLDSQTDAAKAAIAAQRTQALSAFTGGNPESVMTPTRYYTDVWGLELEKAEQIVEEAVEAQEQQMMASTASGGLETPAALQQQQIEAQQQQQAQEQAQQQEAGTTDQEKKRGEQPEEEEKGNEEKAKKNKAKKKPKKKGKATHNATYPQILILNENTESHTPTLAIDLDGTLANYDKWRGEDHFGSLRTDSDGYTAADGMRELHNLGCRLIIWTTRGNTERVREWLDNNEVPYDTINENPDQPEGTSRKVIADLYADDRAVDARKPWREIVKEIKSRMSTTHNMYEGSALVKSFQRLGKLLAQHEDPSPMPGYGQIFINDRDDGGKEAQVWYVGGDGDDDGFQKVVEREVRKVFPSVSKVIYEAETFPKEDEGWVQVYPKYKKWITNNTASTHNVERLTPEHFHALANLQRDKPEHAMLKVQFANGGGVLNPVVEHTGDLIHRMSEKPTFYNAGYEFVKPKVERVLHYLTRGWEHDFGDPTEEFRREHEQNIKNNIRATGVDPTLHRSKLNARLKKYAEEHAKLPAYNEAHRHARGAAVAIGEQRYNDAVKHLRALREHLGSKEDWIKYAHAGLGEPITTENTTSTNTLWHPPSLKDEGGEIDRTAHELGIEHHTLHQAIARGKLIPLNDSAWTNLENTDSQKVHTLHDVVQIAKKYGKDHESILHALHNKEPLPAPIVLRKPNGSHYLISGNTRLMTAKAIGVRPYIWLADLSPKRVENTTSFRKESHLESVNDNNDTLILPQATLDGIKEAGRVLSSSENAMPMYGQIFYSNYGTIWYVSGTEGNPKLYKKAMSALTPYSKRITYKTLEYPPVDGSWWMVYPRYKKWDGSVQNVYNSEEDVSDTGTVPSTSLTGLLTPHMEHWPMSDLGEDVGSGFGYHRALYHMKTGKHGLIDAIEKEGYSRLYRSHDTLHVETHHSNLDKVRRWINHNVDPRHIRTVEYTLAPRGVKVVDKLGEETNNEATQTGYGPQRTLLNEIQKVGRSLQHSSPNYGQIFSGPNGQLWYVGDDVRLTKIARDKLHPLSKGEIIYQAAMFPPQDGRWYMLYPEYKKWGEQSTGNVETTNAEGIVHPSLHIEIPDYKVHRADVHPPSLEALEPFGITSHHHILHVLGAPSHLPIHHHVVDEVPESGSHSLVESEVEGPHYAWTRHIDPVNKEVHNESIWVAKKREGTGSQIFHSQVKHLTSLGFTKIHAHAKRGKELNGYYTLPVAFGYNGKLSDRERKNLPREYQHAEDMHQLTAIPGAAKWWKKNGWSKHLTFDLTPGSEHHKRLEAYMAASAKKRAEMMSKQGQQPTGNASRSRGEELNLAPWEEEAALEALRQRFGDGSHTTENEQDENDRASADITENEELDLYPKTPAGETLHFTVYRNPSTRYLHRMINSDPSKVARAVIHPTTGDAYVWTESGERGKALLHERAALSLGLPENYRGLNLQKHDTSPESKIHMSSSMSDVKDPDTLTHLQNFANKHAPHIESHIKGVTTPTENKKSPIVAGLAVVAKDTGRVLMLQRKLKEDDKQ